MQLQLLTDVHLPLLELVVEEAFQAAIDVAGQENLDVRLHEMRFAMPPLKVLLSRTACYMDTCSLCAAQHPEHILSAAIFAAAAGHFCTQLGHHDRLNVLGSIYTVYHRWVHCHTCTHMCCTHAHAHVQCQQRLGKTVLFRHTYHRL